MNLTSTRAQGQPLREQPDLAQVCFYQADLLEQQAKELQRLRSDLEALQAAGSVLAEQNAKLRAQLQPTETLDNLGKLAGSVAHDVNNVLGTILSMASVNLMVQAKDSPAYLAFELIAKAAVRGGKLTGSLLEFARKNPAEEKILALNARLVEEVRLLEQTNLSKVGVPCLAEAAFEAPGRGMFVADG